MTLRDQLLLEVEDFLKRSGMAPGTFGTYALDDGRFVNRLRAGGDVRTQTLERVREFIRDRDAKASAR